MMMGRMGFVFSAKIMREMGIGVQECLDGGNVVAIIGIYGLCYRRSDFRRVGRRFSVCPTLTMVAMSAAA